jgi:pyruvate,orthophosphate dikinase
MTQKRVYLFKEGNADMRNLLGGKGANLAEMTNAGLPVPPGLTITTETCMEYIDNGNAMPAGLMNDVKTALSEVEKATGKKIRRRSQPAFSFSKIRRKAQHAGNDGNNPQPRP